MANQKGNQFKRKAKRLQQNKTWAREQTVATQDFPNLALLPQPGFGEPQFRAVSLLKTTTQYPQENSRTRFYGYPLLSGLKGKTTRKPTHFQRQKKARRKQKHTHTHMTFKTQDKLPAKLGSEHEKNKSDFPIRLASPRRETYLSSQMVMLKTTKHGNIANTAGLLVK